MAKVNPPKDIGVPVPSPAPDPADQLVVYYQPTGTAPQYNQSTRIVVGPVSSLAVKTVNGVQYWDDPIGSELPVGVPNGTYDFCFTLMDANGNEGDFSPPFAEAIDTVVPPTLGQPVALS